MILVAGEIFAGLLTMLALHWRRVPMKVPHVSRNCVSVDELQAHCALGFIGI